VTTTIGVSCSSRFTFFAVVDGGSVVVRGAERMELPATEISERLATYVDDAAREIKLCRAETLCLLLPEHAGSAPVSYVAVSSRVALETLTRLASVRANVPVVMMSRQTVRSRLGCPKSGALDTHLDNVFPVAVGRYWRVGRGIAAMAALAGQTV
jgi:hypothetical protein